MDASFHPLSELFAQLGLPSDPAAIEAFISRHRPAALGQPLHAAPVWSPSQAAFLREAIADDADWAEPAEALTHLMCR